MAFSLRTRAEHFGCSLGSGDSVIAPAGPTRTLRRCPHRDVLPESSLELGLRNNAENQMRFCQRILEQSLGHISRECLTSSGYYGWIGSVVLDRS